MIYFNHGQGMKSNACPTGACASAGRKRNAPFAFAPVINSGTGVIVIAFIAGLITYRRIRARQGA